MVVASRRACNRGAGAAAGVRGPGWRLAGELAATALLAAAWALAALPAAEGVTVVKPVDRGKLQREHLGNRKDHLKRQFNSSVCLNDDTIVHVPQTKRTEEDEFQHFVKAFFNALDHAPRIHEQRAIHHSAPMARRGGRWVEVGGKEGHTHTLTYLAHEKGEGTVSAFFTQEQFELESDKGFRRIEDEKAERGARIKQGPIHLADHVADSRGSVLKKAHVEREFGPLKETLAAWAHDHMGKGGRWEGSHVSLLHIDCAGYDCASSTLSRLAPYFRPSTVIAFDELIHFPGYREQEFRALYEFLRDTGEQVEVLGIALPKPGRPNPDPPAPLGHQDISVRIC